MVPRLLLPCSQHHSPPRAATKISWDRPFCFHCTEYLLGYHPTVLQYYHRHWCWTVLSVLLYPYTLLATTTLHCTTVPGPNLSAENNAPPISSHLPPAMGHVQHHLSHVLGPGTLAPAMPAAGLKVSSTKAAISTPTFLHRCPLLLACLLLLLSAYLP